MSSENLVGVIELGNVNIKCLISKINEDNTSEIISKSIANTQGIQNGTIVNIKKASDVIRQCINDAEKKANVSLKKINVVIEQSEFLCTKFSKHRKINGSKIDKEDIEFLLKEGKKQVVHNIKLEIAWTVIPFIIVMIIFYWGFKDYLILSIAPEGAIEIKVTGKKWFWTFEYPDSGIKSINECVVPIGKPVKLIMSSEDVLHSFFVPNFRIKRDIVPNKYSNIWFEATKAGTYQVFCTEYCGDAHSEMLASIIVLSEQDYEEWKNMSNYSTTSSQVFQEY